MIILLLFAFFSGMLTIFTPCIWPILPVILSSSIGGKSRPYGVVLGLLTSFTILTLTLSSLVKVIPIDPEVFRYLAVGVISFIGIMMLVPRFSSFLEGLVSRLTGNIGITKQNKTGFGNGFILGTSLGVVWSPCAGPILASVATLAATQKVTLQVVFVAVSYVIGIGVPLLILTLFGQLIFTKTKTLAKHTGKIQQTFGLILIIVALGIITNTDRRIQAKVLDILPSYSNLLYIFENNKQVKTELQKLQGNEITKSLSNLGQAPDFVGIEKWLNTPIPLSMNALKGKVVLVDFWTYTCINCIRTLPYITGWYEKYKDQGFVVVGIHTPEFEFEKKTENVMNAMKQYNIHYPVAQDNQYATWNAYRNQYWPAHYLIDAQGIIRETHFGEGKYKETEKSIQDLLSEMGKKPETSTIDLPDATPREQMSPETYLGYSRMERFVSLENVTGGTQNFTLPLSLPVHYFGFGGEWIVEKQFTTSKKNSVLEFMFSSNKVFLVITPKTPEDIIKVLIDGKKADDSNKGIDVKDGFVTLDQPRLYNLIDLKEKKNSHLLRLEFDSEGIEVYAFTFG